MPPPDIRDFFGKGTAKKDAEKDQESTTKKRRSRMVVSDSEDDEPAPQPKKASPKKLPPKKAVKNSPKGQETTTDDYFASSSKPKKSNATSIKKEAKSESSTPQKATPKDKKEMGSKPVANRRKKEATSYKDEDSDVFVDDDEGRGGDDIFADDMKMNGRRKDDGYIESGSDDEILPKPRASRSKKTSTVKLDDDDVDMMDAPSSKRAASTASKKRKSMSIDLEEESDEDAPPKKGAKKNSTAKKPAPKKPRAPAKKKEPEPETAEMQAIYDSIPLVRPPTPPPQDPDVKYDWRTAAGGGNAGPPPEADDKDWDIGAENCLAGMTFVFTGLLQTISRDRGVEIVKRYGGKVTGAPSKKTTFVVLGTDAGPSKLRKIAEMSIKTIDENGLYALISRVPAGGGDGKAAEKALEKKKAEEAKMIAEAKKQEEADRTRAKEAEKEARRKAEIRGLAPPPTTSRDPMSDQLWTTKYAPTTMAQICGNKGQVEKIQTWLRKWPKSRKVEFSMGGEDGTGKYRAIIIHGPPGIGKTTAAHLAAKLAGYDVIESNASDTRSKKLVETGLRDVLNNSSLLGYFAADGDKVDLKKKNIVLIMDEVDGMSAGDRGGVGALAKICKTTEIPMILICNDRKLPKMKPFDFVTYDLPFRRPTVDMVRSRIATICHREKLKLPMNVIEALIEGSNKDIRQIINMISQVKLDQESMDLQQSKGMSKAWEKHVVLKPWDICHKILGSGMFSPASTASLNDKIELYFNDHEFSYLMVQENYLKCKPLLASNRGYTEKEYRLKVLELADKAAESVSDGDLVDRMIHGSQQQWSLMPTHAVFSTVRPASFMSGSMTGQTEFTKWLGNNSKAGKLTRYVKEIQSHMRMKTSADRHEIRQSYLPVMWTKTIGHMQVDGKEAVDEVIELMDSYYLTREDLDFITELGLDYQDEEHAKLETQTKSTLTRLYNQRSHPMPFMKAVNSGGAMKAAPKVAPDLEEAIEEEDEDIVVADPVDDDDEDVDLKKDKYIKQPKQKKTAGAGKKKAAGKATKKSKKADDDDDDLPDDEEEEDVKPKKAAKPKTKAAPKGRSKK